MCAISSISFPLLSDTNYTSTCFGIIFAIVQFWFSPGFYVLIWLSDHRLLNHNSSFWLWRSRVINIAYRQKLYFYTYVFESIFAFSLFFRSRNGMGVLTMTCTSTRKIIKSMRKYSHGPKNLNEVRGLCWKGPKYHRIDPPRIYELRSLLP